jgi:hypothetical protein
MNTQNNGYELISSLFLRLLAVMFFIAFYSLSSQIVSLVGSDGILPLHYMMEMKAEQWGKLAWWHFPSLLWFNATDTTLVAIAYLGCFTSVLVFLNISPRLNLALTLICYLSLYHAGQIFMNFQWDILLLESGFLALFLNKNSKIIIWLFRWLLFRLRFLSGISKIVSQDPTWLGLTAVTYYFEVQPLPNPLSWYAHHLPETLLIGAVVFTLFVEIIVPFMMFLPRRYRFTAAWLTIFMQIIIMLTSNHNWFNLLTLALCLFLFDDQAVRKVLPAGLTRWLLQQPLPASNITKRYHTYMPLLAGFILVISSAQLYEMISNERVSGPLGFVMKKIKPFAIVNKYHVFPTMRTERYELIISGSSDGKNWKQYHFKYKPGDINTMPGVVMPHHPRLDWLMWFVTLHPHFLHFFESFLDALLSGSDDVNRLLLNNPFPNQPPDIIKVELYLYEFSDPETREKTGQWWQRQYLGLFPPLPYMERIP